MVLHGHFVHAPTPTDYRRSGGGSMIRRIGDTSSGYVVVAIKTSDEAKLIDVLDSIAAYWYGLGLEHGSEFGGS